MHLMFTFMTEQPYFCTKSFNTWYVRLYNFYVFYYLPCNMHRVIYICMSMLCISIYMYINFYLSLYQIHTLFLSFIVICIIHIVWYDFIVWYELYCMIWKALVSLKPNGPNIILFLISILDYLFMNWIYVASNVFTTT